METSHNTVCAGLPIRQPPEIVSSISRLLKHPSAAAETGESELVWPPVGVGAKRSPFLPPFRLSGFRKSVVRHEGIVPSVHHNQELKSEETNIWTGPGRRPLAEPPMLDWDYIMRVWIPSDKRFAALFPGDVEKRARMKDLIGEREALGNYNLWSCLMRDDEGTDASRLNFYAGLTSNLLLDWEDVEEETLTLARKATALGRWEYDNLDNDGRTKGIEECWSRGVDLFRGQAEETKAKYAYTVPQDFVPDPVRTFEHFSLDCDGRTAGLELELRRGRDFMAEWPEKAIWEKYGDFIPPDFEMRNFLCQIREEGGMSKVEELIRAGVDVFRFWPESVKERCAYLIPEDFQLDELATFEWGWLDETGDVKSTERVEGKFRQGFDILAGYKDKRVLERYGYLRDLLPVSVNRAEVGNLTDSQIRWSVLIDLEKMKNASSLMSGQSLEDID